MGIQIGMGRRRHGVAIVATIAVSAMLAFVAPASGQSSAQTPPARLSWYGDPKAPDLSGVWERSDTATSGSGSKEGWLPWPPPLKPAFAATWAKRVAEAAAGKRTDDPVRGCLPPGMPRYITGTNGPLLITQTPGRVTLYRDGISIRRVWLTGNTLPAAKDIENFFNGNAIGRYEGSDLVTEIVGMKDQPIDSTGVPHSNDLKVSERFHRIDATTLRVQITLDDPTAYTRKMTSTVTYKSVKDPLWEPREFLCTPGANYHPEKYVR